MIFGIHLDLEAQKEIDENINILDEENAEENKEIAAKLFERLKRKRPVPEKEDCECQSKIARFNEAKQSFKKI